MSKANNMKATVFSAFQTLGPSLTMGIAVIPLGGLLLGLSSIFTNTTFVDLAPFLGNGIIVAIATWMSNIGSLIINNLPIIFCVSIATSYCKKDGVAAFSAILGFLAMHTTIGQVLNITAESTADWTRYTTMLGIPTLNMGVLGGMLCGFVVVFCYNHFREIKLPSAFSFFQGKRFIPLVTIVACAAIAIPASYAWPFIQNLISGLADSATGSFSPLTMIIMSVCTMLLIPIGLHTFLYALWAYQLGTYVTASGEVVHGFLTIFLAQMADGVPLTTYIPLTANYLYIAVLIGITYAIIREAKKEQQAETKSLFMGGIVTGLVTGISEPLFFPWVFSAPILYGVGILIVFLGEWITLFLNSAVGISYCGGLVDFLIYGVMMNANNWFLVPIICLVLGFVAYFIGRFLIKRLHLNVPGQECFDVTEVNTTEYKQKESMDISKDSLEMNIIKALGDKENIADIDACATRLRVQVREANLVKKNIFSSLGASGVMAMGCNIQIVYGTQATLLCDKIKMILSGVQVEGTVLQNNHQDIKLKEDIVCPLEGIMVDIKDVPDKIFAGEMMGCGFAIEPVSGEVVSPVNGIIENIFPTKHAIGIISEDGKEILVHLGIDTVKLNGDAFDILVQAGEEVKAGQPICRMNLEIIKMEGYSEISPIIFTNMNGYKVVLDKKGKLNKGDRGIIHFVRRT